MNWTVKGNNCSDFSIHGDRLVQAIENHFVQIAKVCRLGNAAGYRLEQVTANYRAGILGAKGGVELRIVHKGLALAHRPADPQSKTSTVWIYANQDDLPSPYIFEIA
ncbi:hypothetical protein [Alicyclobacillus ferrooxydans]|uniref:Uncharacterized protein n=1 Tax=Alicyclobacillus ferrooxydans TaxID=471514 RepID=A0A0N8PP29_9BACL|nr:hypothetical protein [Alicyclobacillus ferrooxydans]KPV43173.1 hypothetical protein AN477_13875 [Alicyclobacillus ferrooxydans]